MIETAQSVTGRTLREDDPGVDVGLRILADHGRAMSMLVSDGVLPANEGRGYVLRRVIRRAVRRARQLGVDGAVTPRLVDTAVSILGAAYPALAEQHHLVLDVVGREEEGFLRTLATGSTILEEELASGAGAVSGDLAFRLHDTYGFPVELTVEIAEEVGVTVDLEGFEAAMDVQRAQARAAARASKTAGRRAGLPLGARRRGSDRVRGPAPRRLLGPRPGRGRAGRSRSGPRRSGRDLPRPDPVLRRGRGPGRRHRHHRDRDGHRRGLRHRLGPARADVAPRHHQRRALRRPGRPGHHRRRAAGLAAPQPHRHPPAPCRPPDRAGRPRPPAGIPRGAGLPALRLQPPRRVWPPRSWWRWRPWPTPTS